MHHSAAHEAAGSSSNTTPTPRGKYTTDQGGGVHQRCRQEDRDTNPCQTFQLTLIQALQDQHVLHHIAMSHTTPAKQHCHTTPAKYNPERSKRDHIAHSVKTHGPPPSQPTPKALTRRTGPKLRDPVERHRHHHRAIKKEDNMPLQAPKPLHQRTAPDLRRPLLFHKHVTHAPPPNTPAYYTCHTHLPFPPHYTCHTTYSSTNELHIPPRHQHSNNSETSTCTRPKKC